MRAGDTIRVLWHDVPVYGVVLPRRRDTPVGHARVSVSGIPMLVACDGADAGDALLGDQLADEAEQQGGETEGATRGDEVLHAPNMLRAPRARESAT